MNIFDAALTAFGTLSVAMIIVAVWWDGYAQGSIDSSKIAMVAAMKRAESRR